VNEIAAGLNNFDSLALLGRHKAMKNARFKKAPIPIETPLDRQIPSQEIYSFLDKWKRHWVAGDYKNLASDYSDDFRDYRGRDKTQFLKARKKFTNSHANIKVLLKNINIVRSGPKIYVYFTQWFKSDDYKSVGMKRLVLKSGSGGLKIIDERFYVRRANAGKNPWVLHLASYRGKATARVHVERLRKMGFHAFEASSYKPGEGKWYRLMVGRVAGKRQALLLGRELKSAGELYINVLKFPFALEVGIYDDYKRSLEKLKELENEGYAPYLVETAASTGKPKYGIYMGAFLTNAEAMQALAEMADRGFDLRVAQP